MRSEGVNSTATGPDLKMGTESSVAAIPNHVAIIMDGNGRWAQNRGLPRSEGHRAGTENIRRILRLLVRVGVKHLTLFAFSTENWDRPEDEVGFLMELMYQVIIKETPELHEEGVRIRHLGRLDRLPAELQAATRQCVELTKDNQAITLSVAYNYGGRGDIIDAVRAIVNDRLKPQEIDEEVFERYLSTNGQPDPDLIIRTAGEMRLSNFLLWESAYAEYYSTPVLWPDFDEEQVRGALEAFSRRQRRYGKVTPSPPH